MGKPSKKLVKGKFRTGFIPGVSRTSGAYSRSLPGSNEKKYLDTDYADTVVAAAGQIEDSLVHIPQNTTDTGRIGNRVRLRNINIKGTVTLPATSTLGS